MSTVNKDDVKAKALMEVAEKGSDEQRTNITIRGKEF